MSYIHAIERSSLATALVTLFATAACLAAAVGPALA
jgi:hypothetical protein